MFNQAQSSSGRRIRPTAKMLQMMSERARKQGRQLGADVAIKDLHRGRIGSPLLTPEAIDLDTLLKAQKEIEEEIRFTKLNISRREEELRRSCASRKSQSPQMISTPNDMSTSGEMDRYFQVLDHTGPDKTAGAYANASPETHHQCDQVMTYRREQITLPVNGRLKEHHRWDQAVILEKAPPESYPQESQIWHRAQKAAPLRRCPELGQGLWQETREETSHPRPYYDDHYDVTASQSQLQQVQDEYQRNGYAAQQAKYPYNPAPYVRERSDQHDGTAAPRAYLAWQTDDNRNKRDAPQGEPHDESVLHRLADILANKQDRLPRMEPEIFTGDLLQFPIWLNSFEALIEQKTTQASERLFFMGKYTAGDAKSCIQGYLTLYTDEAYKQAKSVLISRYGDKVKVARAYRRRLDEWPVIKAHEGEKLQKFADLLWQCHAAMETISYLGPLDSAEENQKMAKKLPQYVADRWNRVVDRSLYVSGQNPYQYTYQADGQYPSFTQFCEFVSAEARIACGPCNTRSMTSQANNKPERYRKSATFSTHASSSSLESGERQMRKDLPKCSFCKAAHHISRCEAFLNQDVDTKKAFAMANGLCFGCLKRNHRYKDCRNRNPSLMQEKKLKAAADTEKAQADSDKKSGKSPKKDGHETAVTHRVMTGEQDGSKDLTSQGSLHSMILPVMVGYTDSPDEQVMTYALLDSMSDSCFIKEDLITKLHAKGVTTNLEVTTLVSKKVVQTEMVTGLTIRGVNESITPELPRTYGRDDIPIERSLIPRMETVRRWSHLQDVAEQLPPYQEDLDVGLLIGANCSAAMMPKRVVAGKDYEPYALKTAIGWGVIGRMQSPDKNNQESSVHLVHRTSAREVSPVEVQRMFQIEFTENSTDAKMSIEDQQFLEIANNGIHQREDGHFEMPLPLKKGVNLPNNRPAAVKRLNQLKGKLMKNEKFRCDYMAFMRDAIEKGYAEQIPPEEIQGPAGRTWYIPHHGVYHPKKPDKIRVVYDCSAMYQGEALNRCLLQGPDLTNNLTGVLTRFREEPIAVTCDVEGMFHQVGVNKEDRDFLRFLWWEKGNLDENPKEYRMAVHLFGATSSPACANFALKATADRYERRFGTEAAEFVRKNFYVDDGLQSVSTAEEAVVLIERGRELCKAGGFHLHKFVCNDKKVVEQIPDCIRAKNIQKIDVRHEALPVERTLGVEWCVESDAFQFRINLTDKPATHRGILSSISSIYDPLGLVAPFLLSGKKILQEICRDGKEWDDPIDEDVLSRWDRWRKDLLNLSKLKVQRCYRPANFGQVTSVQFHHFADASLEGYGQCSYVRLKDEQNQVTTALVMAKSRVTPVKAVTIPRLELTAALTAVKVSQFLNKELTFKNVQNYYWTDSKVVLGYIANNSKRFHIYVANRVQQIRNRTEVTEWHYVQTKTNPADLSSRGVTADELVTSQLWWKGPPFLASTDVLPLLTEALPIPDGDPEVKEVKKGTVHSSTAKVPKYADLSTRLEYFSNWHRARKAVALCRRYVKILKNRSMKQKVTVDQPTVADICEAEKILLRAEQQKHLPECYKSLKLTGAYPTDRCDVKQRRNNMKHVTNLYRLDPYLGTDELIRVGGRIRRADIPRDQAHPIIIPNGHISKLLIQFYHQRTGHAGRSPTLGEVRAAGYWLLRGRVAVSSVIHQCVTCRKLRYAPAAQKMGDLPADRLEPAPCFTYTGVDYFGPFYIKEGRSERKRWGCLFTCLVTRAIHIEVAATLSTDSFLNAFRRFVGRRGPVRVLRSDRGTNFVGAKAEMAAALAEMDQEKIKRKLLADGCDWAEFKMNIPQASHMGGAWERMIRSARVALTSLLDQHASSLDDELLHTLMVEAEAIVNSRPLTCLEPDSEPLTPFQLLTLKSKVALPPPGNFVKEDLYCRKRWRRVQHLANEFWSRWTKEYLPTLQKRQKWSKPHMNLEVGDMVMLTDETNPRCQWSKALVARTHPSEDGLIRKLTVKTLTGNMNVQSIRLCFCIDRESPPKSHASRKLNRSE